MPGPQALLVLRRLASFRRPSEQSLGSNPGVYRGLEWGGRGRNKTCCGAGAPPSCGGTSLSFLTLKVKPDTTQVHACEQIPLYILDPAPRAFVPRRSYGWTQDI